MCAKKWWGGAFGEKAGKSGQGQAVEGLAWGGKGLWPPRQPRWSKGPAPEWETDGPPHRCEYICTHGSQYWPQWESPGQLNCCLDNRRTRVLVSLV